MIALGRRIDVRSRWLPPAFVFTAAFAARFGMVLVRGGSVQDSASYDTGVYYAAADALVHGRVPYRDFTLVHPPGLMLALTPFAELGRLTTDHLGYMVGTLAWMALGALNSLLVLRICRRMRFGTAASIIAALGYGLWYEATRSEYALRLEPLGNFFLLLGILAFVAAETSDKRLLLIGCGAALGAAMSVKIWYVVPVAIMLGWYVIERRRCSQLGWASLGALGAVLTINGPFYVLAGHRMWAMIVTDQLGRRRAGGNLVVRLAEVASSGQVGLRSTHAMMIAATIVGGLLFLMLCALAWQSRFGRLVTTIAVAQLAVIAASPSFFPYYSDYLAPALSLMVGAAATVLLGTKPASSDRLARRGARVAAAALPVALVSGLAFGIDVVHPLRAVTPGPDRSLQQAVAFARCVQSNTPMALIQLNVLSRDLADHCPLWVDVTGRTYSAPLAPTGRVDGRLVRRAAYRPWQRALRRYLLSGDALVVIQPRQTGISRRTLRQVNRGAVLGRADGYVLHRS